MPSARYDVTKVVLGSADDGTGFNQSIQCYAQRRLDSYRADSAFAGGLALVTALASVEGREILQSLLQKKLEFGESLIGNWRASDHHDCFGTA
jgi:hypothetical protein